MHNPWLLLPETTPFVLPSDKKSILDFNSYAKQEHQIHLELLPEPYLGNPRAKIVLLNLNPGFSKSDILFHRDNAYFANTSRANLRHEGQEYPFYLLDPKNLAAPGSGWWRRKLRWLIDRYGLKKVANEICVIEYFPYHSAKFGFREGTPSQRYSHYLVEEAMKSDALIIQMRSRALWQNSNPRLSSYHHYYELKNPQNPAISGNNCPDGYRKILSILG